MEGLTSNVSDTGGANVSSPTSTGADLAGAAGAGGAGAGAGGGADWTSKILPMITKAAPMLMLAGSLISKDKTMKDLLGVGSLVAMGANMMMKSGSTGQDNAASPTRSAQAGDATDPSSPGTTAPATVTSPGTVAANAAAASNTFGTTQRLKEMLQLSALANQTGAAMGSRGAGFTPMQAPAAPAFQAPVANVAPRQLAPAATPSTNASYQRFLQLIQNRGY